MQLAFYAPLKSPDHPVPSGDRAMARGLMAALQRGGASVTVASTLRSRDGAGDSAAQAMLFNAAKTEVTQAIARGRTEGWQAWITYHNYYKAPDLIGPAVARALGIPYLLVESSRARKRLTGPWAGFAQAAEAASDAADVIFYLTHRDAETLRRDQTAGQRLVHLPPFLAQDALPLPSALDGPMLAVGMLRDGDKRASYQIIAETLALLPTDSWRLDIAGDGPARTEIETMLAPFGDAVRFLGELDATAMAAAYRHASLLFWPGVNEAFGLAYLEAQAAGLPVVAQDRPGVRDVLAPASYPAPESGTAPLAAQITGLLSDTTLRHTRAQAARDFVAQHHLLPTATATLLAGLESCGVRP